MIDVFKEALLFARARGVAAVGEEYILFGLLARGGRSVRAALEREGATHDRLEAVLPPPGEPTSALPHFTSCAQARFEAADRLVVGIGSRFERLLLALLDDSQGRQRACCTPRASIQCDSRGASANAGSCEAKPSRPPLPPRRERWSQPTSFQRRESPSGDISERRPRRCSSRIACVCRSAGLTVGDTPRPFTIFAVC